MYLSDRVDLRSRSLQAHEYRLAQLKKWLDEQGIEDLTELTGRDLARYRRYRREECGVAPSTLRGNAFTYKVFLEFCESIEAVPEGLAAKVRIPSLNEDELARTHDLQPDRVDDVLDYLAKFEYASRSHVTLALFFHIGCRLGGLRAIDVGDFHPDDNFIEFNHRPPATPLKNGTSGERWVALTDEIVELIEDYCRVNRDDVVDDQGRRPLITTRQGRFSESAIRESVYRLTSPCRIGGCPHDREIETCESTEVGRRSTCPSSRSPHDVRSAAIIRMKRKGLPAEVIERRVNATQEVIEQHYDERPREEKLRDRMEQRREHIEDL
ncbi:tyrosine-type recombinase/integrase [Halobellus sp. GM3]|uniref:tyrosine-type recombinase/integrase n=1 Tax=Halobellus sp. GM3 TaxID=3458410 RepID=UPI00403D803E